MTAKFPSLFFAALCILHAGQEPDFRKAAWGMTPEQVKATETGRPAESAVNEGELVLRYEAAATRVLYIFVDNKLVRAKCILEATHEDPNGFIADFAALEPTLLEKYGKPTVDRAIWENDIFQQERLPYLEQDRAHASDILPSDRFTGLSVSLGYLKMYTERTTARSRIIHALTGADHQIVHQVEFRPL